MRDERQDAKHQLESHSVLSEKAEDWHKECHGPYQQAYHVAPE